MTENGPASEGKVEIGTIIKHLNEKWPGQKKCPVCGHKVWVIADRVGGVVAVKESMVMPSEIYPVVLVTCRNCGYVLAFNAGTVGAIEKPTQSEPTQSDEAESGVAADE